MTSEAVLHGGEPVRLVVHLYDDEPLWVLLSNVEAEDDPGVCLHAEHLLAADPRLDELVDLPQGTLALRHRLDDPWTWRRFRTNEVYNAWLENGDLAPTWPYPVSDPDPDDG